MYVCILGPKPSDSIVLLMPQLRLPGYEEQKATAGLLSASGSFRDRVNFRLKSSGLVV